jgi:hypothetical protein
MRRIFTSTIFVAAFAVISLNSFGQCAFSTLAPTGAPGGASINFDPPPTPNAQGFTGTNAAWSNLAGNGFMLTGNTTSATITTPPLSASGQTNVISRFTLERTGSNSIIAYSVTYTTASGTTGVICSGTFSPVINPNSPTVYYLTTPTTSAIQTGSSFEINITFTQTGGMRLDNWGSTATPTNAPLPVKFSSLDARVANSSVSLKWSVGTEEDLSGYSVEKSIDGRNFSNIGFVKASGEGNYTFVDAKPSSISYYRIKSVDINGRYGYSSIALVKAGKAMIVIKAFPTPFIKNISIQHPTADAGSIITISSADGRVVKSVVPALGMQQTDVDLSSAKAGMYLVRYSNANGETETLKILKQQ